MLRLRLISIVVPILLFPLSSFASPGLTGSWDCTNNVVGTDNTCTQTGAINVDIFSVGQNIDVPITYGAIPVDISTVGLTNVDSNRGIPVSQTSWQDTDNNFWGFYDPLVGPSSCNYSEFSGCSFFPGTSTIFSSGSSQSNASSSVPYGDWLLMDSLLLFCVAFIPLNAAYSLISKK